MAGGLLHMTCEQAERTGSFLAWRRESTNPAPSCTNLPQAKERGEVRQKAEPNSSQRCTAKEPEAIVTIYIKGKSCSI